MMVRGRGTLFVVGLGPGSPGLLTPDAGAAIDAAEVVVGYRGYLDRIADRLARKEVVGLDLGQEIERAEAALDRAEEGRTVALVSSGDAGVYGMGGVVWELAARRGSTTEIVNIPGVTAALAASARLGAPLAHDWASVSLSDLLTPWDLIVDRVEAAARSDFVLALYNPRSRARTHQLVAVADLMLRYRDPGTPVGLVENAYRPDERIEVIRLDGLASADVSMFTTVIVGSSRTLVARGKMITPRIHEAKRGPNRVAPPSPIDPGEGIMAESLDLIDRELGPDPADPAERAILRRMIHATADFDHATNVRFGPGLIAASLAALRRGAAVLVDVMMLRAGVRRDLAGPLGIEVVCGLGETGNSDGLTRSAAGLRRAAERLGDGVVVAIGNAPTALIEAIRLVEQEGWRPAAIVGIPVGFVGVVESKNRLIEQGHVPFLTSLGRKGGTAVTAAAVNALLELAGREGGP